MPPSQQEVFRRPLAGTLDLGKPVGLLFGARRVLRDAAAVLVFNQADRLPPGAAEAIAARHEGVAISALRGEGLSELLERVAKQLWREDIPALRRRRLSTLTAGRPGR